MWEENIRERKLTGRRDVSLQEAKPGGCRRSSLVQEEVEEAKQELPDNLPDCSPAGWPGPVPSSLLKVQSPGRAAMGDRRHNMCPELRHRLALCGTFKLASGDTLVANSAGFLPERQRRGRKVGVPLGPC